MILRREGSESSEKYAEAFSNTDPNAGSVASSGGRAAIAGSKGFRDPEVELICSMSANNILM
jgi:hypothetical protein